MIAVPTSARPLLPLFRKRLSPPAPALFLPLPAAAAAGASSLSHRAVLTSRQLPEGGVTPGLSASFCEHAPSACRIASGSQSRGGAPKKPIPPCLRRRSLSLSPSLPSLSSREPKKQRKALSRELSLLLCLSLCFVYNSTN